MPPKKTTGRPAEVEIPINVGSEAPAGGKTKRLSKRPAHVNEDGRPYYPGDAKRARIEVTLVDYIAKVKELNDQSSYIIQFFNDMATRVVAVRGPEESKRDQFDLKSRNIQLRAIEELVRETSCSQMRARRWVAENGGGHRSSISKWKHEEMHPKVDYRKSDEAFEAAVLHQLWLAAVAAISESHFEFVREMVEKIRSIMGSYHLVIVTAAEVRQRPEFVGREKVARLKLSSHWVFNFLDRARYGVSGLTLEQKAQIRPSDAQIVLWLKKLDEFAGAKGSVSKEKIEFYLPETLTAQEAYQLACSADTPHYEIYADPTRSAAVQMIQGADAAKPAAMATAVTAANATAAVAAAGSMNATKAIAAAAAKETLSSTLNSESEVGLPASAPNDVATADVRTAVI